MYDDGIAAALIVGKDGKGGKGKGGDKECFQGIHGKDIVGGMMVVYVFLMQQIYIIHLKPLPSGTSAIGKLQKNGQETQILCRWSGTPPEYVLCVYVGKYCRKGDGHVRFMPSLRSSVQLLHSLLHRLALRLLIENVAFPLPFFRGAL